ncbi:Transmembrane protein 65 [Taenia solium]|eukprot:TsM_000947100 transcript=TsM_000947100 gene=TsM_000947100
MGAQNLTIWYLRCWNFRADPERDISAELPLSTFHFSPRRRWQSSKAADGERSASWAFELVNCCSELERKHLHAALESLSATKDPTKDSTPVSHSQLRLVFLASATPFIGFGFLDNFIMIVALAAGIGNLISDLCGLGLVGYVERYATLFGVKAPSLTESQMNSKSLRRCSNLGRMFGITVGCLVGMLPLLFFPYEEDEKTKTEARKGEESLK